MKMNLDHDSKYRLKRLNDTKSQKAMYRYLYSLLENDDFLKKVYFIRRKHKIPKQGFSPNDLSEESKKIMRGSSLNSVSCFHDVVILADELGLDYFWARDLLEYVIYNTLDISTPRGSVFTVKDIYKTLYGPFKSDKAPSGSTYEEVGIWEIKFFAKYNQAVLFIPPHVIKEDILDYVKKMYEVTISPIQQRYKKKNIRLGKVYIKNLGKQARDKRIYVLHKKGFSARKIVPIIAIEYKDNLDYTYINKIIRDQKRKNLQR